MFARFARRNKGLWLIPALAAGVWVILWYQATLGPDPLDPDVADIVTPTDQSATHASPFGRETLRVDPTPPPAPKLSATKPTPDALFRKALASSDYESAVAKYDRLYTEHGIEHSDVFRQILINHASSLIQDRDTASAIKLLRTYLAVFYNDMDVLFTLGRAYRDDGQLLPAFEAFQAAYRNAYGATVRGVIMVQQYDVIARYVQQLKEQNKLEEVIQLYLRLSKSQPYVPGYYIALARAYAEAQRYSDAIRTLRYVQADIDVGPQATRMIQEYLIE